MTGNWLQMGAMALLGVMGLSILAIFIGACLGDLKSTGGKLMLTGGVFLFPLSGLLILVLSLGLFGHAGEGTIAFLFIFLIGGGATIFSVGFAMNRLNRPTLPKGPAPYIPQGPESAGR